MSEETTKPTAAKLREVFERAHDLGGRDGETDHTFSTDLNALVAAVRDEALEEALAVADLHEADGVADDIRALKGARP